MFSVVAAGKPSSALRLPFPDKELASLFGSDVEGSQSSSVGRLPWGVKNARRVRMRSLLNAKGAGVPHSRRRCTK